MFFWLRDPDFGWISLATDHDLQVCALLVVGFVDVTWPWDTEKKLQKQAESILGQTLQLFGGKMFKIQIQFEYGGLV